MARTTSLWCRKIGTNEWIFCNAALVQSGIAIMHPKPAKKWPYLNFKCISWICIEQLNCYMHHMYLLFLHTSWFDLQFWWIHISLELCKGAFFFRSQQENQVLFSKLPTKHRILNTSLEMSVGGSTILMNHAGDRNPCGDFRCFPFLLLSWNASHGMLRFHKFPLQSRWHYMFELKKEAQKKRWHSMQSTSPQPCCHGGTDWRSERLRWGGNTDHGIPPGFFMSTNRFMYHPLKKKKINALWNL